MEQLADFAPVVQILDVPVPQTVDQLVEVLKIVDYAGPEQVIEVPKISCPVQPSRVVLRATQMAEQSEEVPRRALFIGRDGQEWRPITGPTGVYYWRVGTPHPENTPPAQGGTQILGKVDDIPVITHAKFQQFFETVEVPQVQFFDRLPDIPVVPQRQVQENRASTGAVLGKGVRAVVAQRLVAHREGCRHP